MIAAIPRARPAPTPKPDRSLAEILSLEDSPRFAIETLALLGLIWLWRHLPVAATVEQGGMPHPYWLPVLLMSAQYGIMGGLFASLAATAAFFGEGLPSASATSDFYDLAAQVTAQPFAWFAAALVLGGLRTLHRHHQAIAQQELVHTTRLADTLADCVEKAVAQIGRLERRIATDAATTGALLRGLERLDLSDHAALLGSMLDLVQLGTGAASFAIYLPGEKGLEPRAGLIDGVSVGADQLPPLPAALRDLWRDESACPQSNADVAGEPAAPIWAPIGMAAGSPLGVIACTRLNAGQDPIAARRRLTALARLLAQLLQNCPGGLVPAVGA